MLQIITRFCASYRDAIDGKLTELSVNELYGGARINYIFNEIYARCLNDISPTDGLTVNDIRTAIRNATVCSYLIILFYLFNFFIYLFLFF